MNSIKNISVANYCETFGEIGRKKIFYCMIEANQNDPGQYEDQVLEQLLNETQAKVRERQAILSPAIFADGLDEVVSEWSARSRRQVVFYAGVLVEQDRIEVCTAGDIRVHLIGAGALVAITRDHNMIQDPPEDPEHDVTSLEPEFLKSVPTRYIDGSGRSQKPELWEWNVREKGSVMICTSGFHKYASPENYLKLVSNLVSQDAGTQGKGVSGSLAVIEWDWSALAESG